MAAEYGVVPGRRSFDEKDSPDYYIRERDYPPGVFAVSMPDRPRLLAFDADSNNATLCTRTEQPPFELPHHINAKYARFRCPGEWRSRAVVFLDAAEFEPIHAEQLEWTALAGPPPLPMPRAKPATDLHDYTAAAVQAC